MEPLNSLPFDKACQQTDRSASVPRQLSSQDLLKIRQDLANAYGIDIERLQRLDRIYEGRRIQSDLLPLRDRYEALMLLGSSLGPGKSAFCIRFSGDIFASTQKQI